MLTVAPTDDEFMDGVMEKLSPVMDRVHDNTLTNDNGLTFETMYDGYILIDKLYVALWILYHDTKEYIRINNLGDPHHNQGMKLAREALRECTKDQKHL